MAIQPFKVINGKAIRDCILIYNNVGLISRRRSVRKPWKSMFSITPLVRLTPPLQGIPRNIHINLRLYCQNLESLGYIVVADSMGLFSFKFSWRAPIRHTCFETRVRNDPSWWSKVIDFGTNRKRVCDFLLVNYYYNVTIVTLVLPCPVSEIPTRTCLLRAVLDIHWTL